LCNFIIIVLILGEYNSVFISINRKTEKISRKIRKKVRENVEITRQTAICYFERILINLFMFFNKNIRGLAFFFTSVSALNVAFKGAKYQLYSKII
ncbi:hypothetical protein HZS_3393, partial [Henneguya salminicola]